MMDAPGDTSGKARLDSAVACSGVSEKAIRGDLIRRTIMPTTAHARHADGHAPLRTTARRAWRRVLGAPRRQESVPLFLWGRLPVHRPQPALHHRSDFFTNCQVPKGKKY